MLAFGSRLSADVLTRHDDIEIDNCVLTGDAFSHHDNMAFSTYDKDNDLASYNCAAAYHGGFWYKACSMVRLTGRWGETPADEIVNGTNGLITYHQGIIWSTWLTFLKHPKTAVMMIRPAA